MKIMKINLPNEFYTLSDLSDAGSPVRSATPRTGVELSPIIRLTNEKIT